LSDCLGALHSSWKKRDRGDDCFGFDLFSVCFHGAQDFFSLSPVSRMKMLISFVDKETVSQEDVHKLTRTWLREGGAEICIRAGPQVAQDSLFL